MSATSGHARSTAADVTIATVRRYGVNPTAGRPHRPGHIVGPGTGGVDDRSRPDLADCGLQQPTGALR